MNKHYYISILCMCMMAIPIMYVHTFDINAHIDFVETAEGYRIDATNNEPFDVYMVITVTSTGFKSTISFPASIHILQGKTKGIFALTKLPNARRYQYRSRYSIVFSDIKTTVPDDYLYSFPFAHGSPHRVVQGWNGSFSHHGQNKYALDFDLEEGTEVRSARGGLVVAIKEDSKIGGISRVYSDHANYVMIRHDDGTIGNYVHLQYQGALVNKGSIVKVGDVIGISGSTGLASGPHLHFDVRVPSIDGVMQSIPFHFLGKDNTAVKPEVGHTYYARVPEGAEFTEIHGSDITIEQFADYSANVSATFPADTLEIRKELYDDTLLLFLENGFSKPVNATVQLILTNVRSKHPLPITTTVAPRKEVFLTIVKIIDVTKHFAVKAQMKFVFVD